MNYTMFLFTVNFQIGLQQASSSSSCTGRDSPSLTSISVVYKGWSERSKTETKTELNNE